MRKELRRYSSIGNREGILLFCSKVLTGEWENLTSIQISCSFIIGINLNCRCAEMLFEDMGLVEIQENLCKSKGLRYDKSQEEEFISKFCNIFFLYLINDNLIDRDLIKFDEDTDRFYIPTYAFRLDSAIIRNLLKELSALIVDESKFYIDPEYEHLFCENIKKNTLSQEELMKKIDSEQKMGEAGELFVMDFEKKRLQANDAQAKTIKQISLVDVAAGYDIISYNDNSFRNRRYIEVKTYSGKEHFFWSSNEIKSAKLRGKNYFLYLVDYSKLRDKDYVPLMIEDPYVELKNNPSWNITPDSFYIEKIKEQQVAWTANGSAYPSFDDTNDDFDLEYPMAAEESSN